MGLAVILFYGLTFLLYRSLQYLYILCYKFHAWEKKIKKDKMVSQYSSKPQLVEANHQSNILCFLNFQNTFGLELYESAFCE